jgi:hypothetical protein
MTDLADLDAWLVELSTLSKQYHDIAAPIKAHIKALEVQLAEETASLTFAMDTLEALIKPCILEAKQSQKLPYVTAVYTHRDKWDTELLMTIAKEVPAVLQAYSEASSVSFRKTSH